MLERVRWLQVTSDDGKFEIYRRVLHPGLRGQVVGVHGFQAATDRTCLRLATPRNFISIVFAIGKGMSVSSEKQPHEVPIQGARIVGFPLRPAIISLKGCPACIQIDMTPLAARRLLGEDLIHLPRSAAPLAEFAPNLFDELQVLCDEQVTWEARFNAVEHVLYRRLIEVRGDDRRLSEAISLLSKAPATLSIGGLAEHLQISRKHLNHIFRQAIGVSPKTYARLTRFTAVMTALASPSSKSANLSWLAHEFGFADQSHMCREFISLAEMTPNKLRLLVESTSSNESASSDHRCGQPTGALDAGTTGQPALAVWARLRFAQGAHERS